MTNNTYPITTQKEIHRLFWETFPDLPRKKIKNYSGNDTMYPTDTRCAFTDFIDYLSRVGQISEALAARATL